MQLASTVRESSALINGRKVSIEEAIQKANQLLQDSKLRSITGHIRSVEGARAVLSLASRVGAYLDPSGSNDAFKSILAIQRSGMTTASISEVRFRSDCVVLIGDDRMLGSFPRLANILLQRNGNRLSSSPARVVALGKWSSECLSQLRMFAKDVCSIDVDIASIPQALIQWSRCNHETQLGSPNFASNWMSQAQYLTLVWSPSILDMPHADLWIERLWEWIQQRNASRRCVGFPLVSDYVTFQQVCTWITGFPGRVFIDGKDFRYEPHISSLSGEEIHNDSSTIIHVNESCNQSRRVASRTSPTIIVGPCLDPSVPAPKVFIPCAIPGLDHIATFFRVDATVAVEAFDRTKDWKGDQLLSVEEILGRIGGSPAC